jgi:hypothetical protein
MSNFRAARNQIVSGLSEFGYIEESRQAVRGILTPFMINRIKFSSWDIAQAAVDTCTQHHPNTNFRIREQGEEWFTISTWNR